VSFRAHEESRHVSRWCAGYEVLRLRVRMTRLLCPCASTGQSDVTKTRHSKVTRRESATGYRQSALVVSQLTTSSRLLDPDRPVALNPVPGAVSYDLEIEAAPQCFQAVDANPGQPVRKGGCDTQHSFMEIGF
jgi:hypothetical protein